MSLVCLQVSSKQNIVIVRCLQTATECTDPSVCQCTINVSHVIISCVKYTCVYIPVMCALLLSMCVCLVTTHLVFMCTASRRMYDVVETCWSLLPGEIGFYARF